MKVVNVDSVWPGWDTVLLQSQNEIHVVPVRDVIGHELTDDCACLPVTEAIETNDGEFSSYWMVSHNAWDGRE